MFWKTEHFQCANCAKPQKYLLSFELVCHCQCLAHIQLVHSISWTREHIQRSNPQKCVCQALNHCLAHIELVHSLFSTTSPTRQLPAVRSVLCLVEMDLMKNVKKDNTDDQDDDYADCSQSYRCVSFMPGVTQARLTFITLPPRLQCTQWSIIIHITAIFDNCFVTLSRVWMCFLVWMCLLVCLAILVLEDIQPNH